MTTGRAEGTAAGAGRMRPFAAGRFRPLSLRSKLLLFLAALAFCGTVVLAFAAWEYGRRAADEAYDRLITGSALAIAEAVTVLDGRIDVDLPYAALDMLALAPEDRVFYRVAGPGGETVTGYDDLPLPDRFLPSERPQFFEAEYRGEIVRFCILGRLVADPVVEGWSTIQVGQTRRARDALAETIAVNAVLPILGLSALSLAFGWVGVTYALRPLIRVGADLQARRPTDLRPIATPAPREVQLLLDSLNRFMQRLQMSMDNMQVFIAEAAHQIRTPLTSLQLQAQLALDEDDPEAVRRSLVRIERNAVLAGRVAHQLLSHAMVVHRGDAAVFEAIDLAEVLQQALREAIPVAEHARIEVDFRNEVGRATILGDRVMVREALKNVLDNAVRYGSPDGGPIRVRLHGDGTDGSRCVTVADSGPGLPAAERERVFERFRRGANAQGPGSGLGLAIVRRVIDVHGGSVDLADAPGGGLAVTLRFPRAGGVGPGR